jgi:hypothetical protein
MRGDELQPDVAMFQAWRGHRHGLVHGHPVAGQGDLRFLCWLRAAQCRFDERACIDSRGQLGKHYSQQCQPCDVGFGAIIHDAILLQVIRRLVPHFDLVSVKPRGCGRGTIVAIELFACCRAWPTLRSDFMRPLIRGERQYLTTDGGCLDSLLRPTRKSVPHTVRRSATPAGHCHPYNGHPLLIGVPISFGF